MIQLSSILWLGIFTFGVIGYLRGFDKELVGLSGIVLALFTLVQFNAAEWIGVGTRVEMVRRVESECGQEDCVVESALIMRAPMGVELGAKPGLIASLSVAILALLVGSGSGY